jgi:hypothetical protein
VDRISKPHPRIVISICRQLLQGQDLKTICEQPCRRLVPTQGADRVSAPTRRCRIDGPGLAITRVGWARHGQENYYAPTAGAEETGGRGLATTHTGKGCVMAN